MNATSGRSGVHGQVDAILSELGIAARVDDDGDWRIDTEAGPFLLIVDPDSSDLILVQTFQAIRGELRDSASEMYVLLALNFEASGIARFASVNDGGQNLLVLTARLAPDRIAHESVDAMLRDSLRLSRRVDELLGNADEPASDGQQRV